MRRGGRLKGLIVGVDPGVRTGLAVLDLEKNLLKLYSERDLSEEDVIEIVSKEGIPAVIACDVNPAPGFVEGIASKVKAGLFVPKKDLKVRKKNSLVHNFLGRIPKDNHKRDALASGIRAYNFHSARINELERKLKKLGIKQKEKYKIYSLKHPRKNVLKQIEKVKG